MIARNQPKQSSLTAVNAEHTARPHGRNQTDGDDQDIKLTLPRSHPSGRWAATTAGASYTQRVPGVGLAMGARPPRRWSRLRAGRQRRPIAQHEAMGSPPPAPGTLWVQPSGSGGPSRPLASRQSAGCPRELSRGYSERSKDSAKIFPKNQDLAGLQCRDIPEIFRGDRPRGEEAANIILFPWPRPDGADPKGSALSATSAVKYLG